MKKSYVFAIFLVLLLAGYFLWGALKNRNTAENEQIVLYTSVNIEDITPVVDRFQQLTGIKVDVWKASGSTVVTRVLEEARADKLQADVVMLNMQRMSILDGEGILLAYLAQNYHPFCIQYITLGYNTQNVKTPPRRYEDLLKPEYSGLLAMEVDSVEWELALFDILGEDFFMALNERLAKQEIRGVDGKRFLTEMLVSGEVSLAINLPNNFIEQAKKKGAPVEWIALEPVVAHAQAAALVRDSVAARRFIDFLLSSEGQQVILEVGRGAPVDHTLQSPLFTGFSVVFPEFD